MNKRYVCYRIQAIIFFALKMLRKVKLLRKPKRMLCRVIIISLVLNSLRVDGSPFLKMNRKPTSINSRGKRMSFGAPWMIPESALKGVKRFWGYWYNTSSYSFYIERFINDSSLLNPWFRTTKRMNSSLLRGIEWLDKYY